MDKALVRGRIVDAGNYRLMSHAERAVAGPPTCPECRVQVAPYGMASLVVPPRFDHPDASEDLDPLDDCSLAHRSQRLRWFGQDNRNMVRGKLIRDAFFEVKNIQRAYAFCLSRTGRGSLPIALFGSMIRRADRLGVWSYVGVEPWCVPHILLLLADYRSPRGIPFHFSLVRAARISAIWEGPHPVEIIKLFSDTGNPFRSVPSLQNPAPILPTDVEGIDTAWMGSGMTRTLAAFG